MKRVFLLLPGENRRKWAMWVEFDETVLADLYMRQIRHQYRTLRRAGIENYDARSIVFKLLVAGRRMKRNDLYGGNR
jgi:hypothetical protein